MKTPLVAPIGLLIAILFSLFSLQAQTTYVWSSSNGDYSAPQNWSPNGVPGPADTVMLASGFLTLDMTTSISKFEMTGGILQGDKSLTISQTAIWSDGDITISDTLLIDSTANFLISGPNKDLNGTTLLNFGNVIWTEDGRISLKNQAKIVNHNSLEITGNALIDYVLPDSGGTFTNYGSIKKTSSGLSTIDGKFSQNGSIDVQAGTLRFERGSDSSIKGTIQIQPMAEVQFDERIFLIDSLYISGGGLCILEDATFQLLNNGLTVEQDGHIVFERNDFLIEGNGPLTIDGFAEWQRGTISGSGGIVLNGTLTMNGAAVTLSGQTLNNNGLLGWESTGALLIADSAVVNNLASGVFEIQNNENIRPTVNGDGAFNNYGLLNKSSGGGVTIFELPFNNYGSITTIQDGSIIAEFGGEHINSTLTTGSSTAFSFDSKTNIISNMIMDGEGTVYINGATLDVQSGGLNIGPTATLELDAGILSLSSKVTIDGEFRWLKGVVRGQDTLQVSSTLTLIEAPAKDLSETIINNLGTISWIGRGDLKLRDQAGIINTAGATIDFQSNALLDFVLVDNGGWLVNDGLLVKSAGDGETNIDAVFTNRGRVDVQTGKVRIERGSDSTSSGIFNVAENTVLEISERRFIADDLTFTGAGHVHMVDDVVIEVRNSGIKSDTGVVLRLDDSQAQIEGDAPVTIDGEFEWFSGSIAITDTIWLNGIARFDDLRLKILRDAFMSISGEASWYGDGDIRVLNGSVIQVEANGRFNLQNSGVMEYGFSNAGGLINFGMISKEPDSSFASIDVELQNFGILQLNEDTLRCTDELIIAPGATISGNGTLDVLLGTFEHQGNTNPGFNSKDTLGFVGRYQPLTDAILTIEIGDSSADKLDITGIAPLNGILNVQLAEGFIPAIGDTFEIMSANQVYGSFAATNLPTLGAIPIFELSYEPTRVLLVCINNSKVAINLNIALQGAWTSGDSMHQELYTQNLLPSTQPYSGTPWFYEGSETNDSLPPNIVDWVLVEIKNQAFQTTARKAALLKTDGSIVEADGSSNLCISQEEDSLYVIVHHRHHLPIMTATPIMLTATATAFDFTADQAQAFGIEPMIEVSPGVFALPGGNGSPDDSIDLTDINTIWSPQAGTRGYLSGDFNMNGEVQNDDKNLLWKKSRGKTSQIPSATQAKR